MYVAFQTNILSIYSEYASNEMPYIKNCTTYLMIKDAVYNNKYRRKNLQFCFNNIRI